VVGLLGGRRLPSVVVAAWFAMDDFEAHRAGALPWVPLQRPSSAQLADTQNFLGFDEFYRRFVPSLVAFLVWQGARFVEAADIVQEIMCRVCQEWAKINQPMTWARTAASQELARRIASLEDDTDRQLFARNSLVPESFDGEIWGSRHEVLRMLDRLSSRQRQVMAWTLEGYSPAEIASELHLDFDVVRANLAQARRTLGTTAASSRTNDEQY
jgi:RNA polymerase sigma factor (sigma-70 family)